VPGLLAVSKSFAPDSKLEQKSSKKFYLLSTVVGCGV